MIYLSYTKPNIAYVVALGVVSQFIHDPKAEHLQAIQRILKYLKAIPRKGLLFKKGSNLIIEGYTDADYTRSPIDKRSTTSYCTFI